MKLSIVTPVLNGARFLEQTIASIHGQQAPGLEIEHIVMDGGSTDGTQDILRRHADKLRWQSGRDRCQSDAINKGWSQCSGELLAWINADDFYEPGAFARACDAAAAHPAAPWFFGYYRMVDAGGREIRRVHAAYKHFLMRHYSYRLQLAENVIAQPSVFLTRRAWEAVRPLDAESPHRMAFDYDLWMRLGRVGDPVLIRQVLSNFRWHAGSITGARMAELFRHELAYAARERERHPAAFFLHRLNYIKIRLLYNLLKW